MAKLANVKDEDIFINSNSLTSAIKGKRMRLELLNNGIKLDVRRVQEPASYYDIARSDKEVIHITFHKSVDLHFLKMNRIANDISLALRKKGDRQKFAYINEYSKESVL